MFTGFWGPFEADGGHTLYLLTGFPFSEMGAERATRASLQLEKAPLILLDLTGSNDNDSSQRQYGEAILELHLWGTASFWEEKGDTSLTW